MKFFLRFKRVRHGCLWLERKGGREFELTFFDSFLPDVDSLELITSHAPHQNSPLPLLLRLQTSTPPSSPDPLPPPLPIDLPPHPPPGNAPEPHSLRSPASSPPRLRSTRPRSRLHPPSENHSKNPTSCTESGSSSARGSVQDGRAQEEDQVVFDSRPVSRVWQERREGEEMLRDGVEGSC